MIEADLLAKVELFQNLDQQELESIARIATAKIYEDGDAILREGERGTHFGIILFGRAQVAKNMGAARPTVLATLGEGDVFGEEAILGWGFRSASVVAWGPVQCAFLGQWDVLAVLVAHPEKSVRFLQRLRGRYSAQRTKQLA